MCPPPAAEPRVSGPTGPECCCVDEDEAERRADTWRPLPAARPHSEREKLHKAGGTEG